LSSCVQAARETGMDLRTGLALDATGDTERFSQ
jgi:hypothetical protein